jgi:hypothetical protein
MIDLDDLSSELLICCMAARRAKVGLEESAASITNHQIDHQIDHEIYSSYLTRSITSSQPHQINGFSSTEKERFDEEEPQGTRKRSAEEGCGAREASHQDP